MQGVNDGDNSSSSEKESRDDLVDIHPTGEGGIDGTTPDKAGGKESVNISGSGEKKSKNDIVDINPIGEGSIDETTPDKAGGKKSSNRSESGESTEVNEGGRIERKLSKTGEYFLSHKYKGSVCFILKLGLPPFSPLLPFVMQFWEQNRHWTFASPLYISKYGDKSSISNTEGKYFEPGEGEGGTHVTGVDSAITSSGKIADHPLSSEDETNQGNTESNQALGNHGEEDTEGSAATNMGKHWLALKWRQLVNHVTFSFSYDTRIWWLILQGMHEHDIWYRGRWRWREGGQGDKCEFQFGGWEWGVFSQVIYIDLYVVQYIYIYVYVYLFINSNTSRSPGKKNKAEVHTVVVQLDEEVPFTMEEGSVIMMIG